MYTVVKKTPTINVFDLNEMTESEMPALTDTVRVI